jgi:hypothetical protein
MRNEKKTLNEVLKQDFKYDIEYDYDTNRDNCECEDYCRCSTIENAKVTYVDLIRITEEFNKVFEGDEFTKYIINRILTACKLYDEDSWWVSTCGGYYGEEIEGIYIENTNIEEWLNKLENAKTNEEKLFVALECEYGYVLDELKGLKSFTIETVDRANIIVGQKDHYVRLNRNVINKYKDYPYLVALCIDNGKETRLIDGYHRFSASEDKEKVKVIIGRL